MRRQRVLARMILSMVFLGLAAKTAMMQEAVIPSGPVESELEDMLIEVPNLRIGTELGNRVMVETNQLLDPAGARLGFSGRPVDVAVSPKGDVLAILLRGPGETSVISLCTTAGVFVRTLQLPSGKPSFLGLAFSPDGTWIAASGSRGISLCSVDGTDKILVRLPHNALPSGLAFDSSGQVLYAALNATHEVVRVSIKGNAVTAAAKVGLAPLGVAVAPQTNRLFVTNWAGRRPRAGDATAATAGTPAAVDPRGIVSTGSVSVVDLESFSVVAEIPTGLHPSGIRISPDGLLAAVANANSDSVTFIDTRTLRVLDTRAIPAYPQGYTGSSPTSLAFGPSGQFLYVTCGGNNAVAVLQKRDATFWLKGFIPTDWYPVGVSVLAAPGSDTLYVANAKGTGSRSRTTPPYRVQDFEGTVSIIADPAVDDVTVSETNTPFMDARRVEGSPAKLDQLGVKHVFLIIKENRTYDQVLGDLGKGDGEAALAIYGREITPNQHRLAADFVTLDNFYDSGTVSPEGHHWLTQAMASDYLERSSSAGWPRTYPYRGEDPLAFASTGFLWDNARAHLLTTRIFGEFGISPRIRDGSWSRLLADASAANQRFSVKTSSEVAALNVSGVLAPNYPGFDLSIPDTWRARVFLDTFARETPANLFIIQLPGDHTLGLTPGSPTPSAMVADNDLAVGQIVEAISNSALWPKSVIFIVEDDSQAGVDHVDGHRTVCLVVSPFVRRGAVDSTLYNHLSVVRSIEDLLGLPPMNKYDASALPMRSVFTTTPDAAPHKALAPRVSLRELVPDLRNLAGPEERAAIASLGMDFTTPDGAPSDELNKILWSAARGWNTPYPQAPSSIGRASPRPPQGHGR